MSSASFPPERRQAHEQNGKTGQNLLPIPDIFPEGELVPRIKPGSKMPDILGNGALIKFASDGGDVSKVFEFFAEQVRQSPHDASLQLDLALRHLIREQWEEADRIQAE